MKKSALLKFQASPGVQSVESSNVAGSHVDEEPESQVDPSKDPERDFHEKKYMRKLNWTILPMISALYFFSYLDRGNIAVGIPLEC